MFTYSFLLNVAQYIDRVLTHLFFMFDGFSSEKLVLILLEIIVDYIEVLILNVL